MGLETISESTFLLTELRYTLGQLHVQVLDLDPEARKQIACGDRSIDQILSEMVESEDRWQARYAELLDASAMRDDSQEIAIPLPVDAEEEIPGIEATFEHKRAKTIALLERANTPWPHDLLDAVKQQIAEDRKLTTEIAECRKEYFIHDQRPDLNEPLDAAEHQPGPSLEIDH